MQIRKYFFFINIISSVSAFLTYRSVNSKKFYGLAYSKIFYSIRSASFVVKLSEVGGDDPYRQTNPVNSNQEDTKEEFSQQMTNEIETAIFESQGIEDFEQFDESESSKNKQVSTNEEAIAAARLIRASALETVLNKLGDESHDEFTAREREIDASLDKAMSIFGGQDEIPKSPTTKTFDYLAIVSYITATGIQWTLLVTFVHLFQIFFINRLRSSFPKMKALEPFGVFLLFLFLSLRSRVFSVLDNSRPKPTKTDPVFQRKMPSWQPRPLVFPIVWSIISLLRGSSTALVYHTTGTLLCTPIFAMLAHLSIGDTWNTINNVERRLGASWVGVQFVYFSAIYMAYQYLKTNIIAGRLISLSCVWLTIANALIFTIWRLNSDRTFASLIPYKEEAKRCPWRLPFTSWTK
jgi:tryptophan-rich sensory protein